MISGSYRRGSGREKAGNSEDSFGAEVGEDSGQNAEGGLDEQELLERIQREALSRLNFNAQVDDSEVLGLIDELMLNWDELKGIPLRVKNRIRQKAFYSMRGLDVLTPLLEDDTVTEIMVNGSHRIYVERGGVISLSGLEFSSESKYRDVIQKIVSGANRVVNESDPIVDARLPDGSRVNVVLSPVSLDGSSMTIRKFPREPMTMDKLVDIGSLSRDAADFLALLVKSRYNILISGGTGSGKTTFLNALSDSIPDTERVITIEDSAELQLKHVDNLVRLEVRNAYVEGARSISIRDLIRSSLRMRPDRIVVGEVRGQEAADLLTSLNTGHDGGLSSIHANSAVDMLVRLETMVLTGCDIPLGALRRQIASAVDIIIQLGRLRDHSRRVLEIVEVLDVKDGEIRTNTLYRFQESEPDGDIEEDSLREDAMNSRTVYQSGDSRNTGEASVREEQEADKRIHAHVEGQLVPVHMLKQVNKLRSAGYYHMYIKLHREAG